MKVITRNVLLLAMIFASMTAFAQKGGGDDVLKQKIQSLNNEIVQATLAGDDAKILSFYDANAISLPNYSKALMGIEAITNSHNEAKAAGNKITAFKLMTKKTTAYGNAVVEVGMYTLTMVIPGMPQPINDEGKYLTVWLKQTDGSYKIINEIWNTNIHPMKGTPKGDPGPSLQEKEKLNSDQNKSGTTKSGKKKTPATSDDKK